MVSTAGMARRKLGRAALVGNLARLIGGDEKRQPIDKALNARVGIAAMRAYLARPHRASQLSAWGSEARQASPKSAAMPKSAEHLHRQTRLFSNVAVAYKYGECRGGIVP